MNGSRSPHRPSRYSLAFVNVHKTVYVVKRSVCTGYVVDWRSILGLMRRSPPQRYWNRLGSLAPSAKPSISRPS